MLALSCKANWLSLAKVESAPFAEQFRAFRKNICISPRAILTLKFAAVATFPW